MGWTMTADEIADDLDDTAEAIRAHLGATLDAEAAEALAQSVTDGAAHVRHLSQAVGEAREERDAARTIVADARYLVEADMADGTAMRATLAGNGLEPGVAVEYQSDLDRLRTALSTAERDRDLWHERATEYERDALAMAEPCCECEDLRRERDEARAKLEVADRAHQGLDVMYQERSERLRRVAAAAQALMLAGVDLAPLVPRSRTKDDWLLAGVRVSKVLGEER